MRRGAGCLAARAKGWGPGSSQAPGLGINVCAGPEESVGLGACRAGVWPVRVLTIVYLGKRDIYLKTFPDQCGGTCLYLILGRLSQGDCCEFSASLGYISKYQTS